MKISFVMLCYNNWSMTRNAVLSLISSLSPEMRNHDFEFLLVDNGSTDSTATLGPDIIHNISRQPISGSYIRLDENIGIPIGMNVGIGRATGDIVAFLNNDLIFPAGWLDSIVECLVTDQSMGLAVPYLTYTSIKEQGVNPTYSDLSGMPKFASRFMEETRGRIIIIGQTITSCVVFRRDLIQRIGGLDLWFGLGSLEDNDWSLRATMAGYQNAVIGGSFVHHIGSVTYHQLPAHDHIYRINGAKFLRKVGKIKQSDYSREWHYIPITISDFTPPARSPEADEPDGRVLLVADWTNKMSLWCDTLAHLLDSSALISIYIPSLYFDPDEVMARIHDIVRAHDAPLWPIEFLTDDIPPADFLGFIMQFSTIATVPEDAVNRAIRFLKESYLNAQEVQ